MTRTPTTAGACTGSLTMPTVYLVLAKGRRIKAGSVCASLVAAAPHHAPLAEAAAQGAIRLVLIERGAQVPADLMPDATSALPTVFVVGDDDAAKAGPDAFPGIAAILSRADLVFINSAAPNVLPYVLLSAGVTMPGAPQVGVMVESTPARAAAWKALFEGVRKDGSQLTECRPPASVH